jgi:dimethylargininase
MDLAITRDPSPALARCELTHLERAPIDFARAVEQHRAYLDLLAELGLAVLRLPPDDAHPDACFVEDTAVVLDELAVMCRPGAASRRGETAAVAAALAPYRPLVHVPAPATLDGGDVLVLGRRVFVGRTARTNPAGIESLRAALGPRGYDVATVEVAGCLHLKSAVTAVDDDTVLANPEWIDARAFEGRSVLAVDRAEPAAANVLRIGRSVVAHAGFPRTVERLRRHGAAVRTLDVSEFLKAEGALTCKSLLARGVS